MHSDAGERRPAAQAAMSGAPITIRRLLARALKAHH